MRTKDEEEFLKGIGLEKLLPGICRSRGGPGTRRGKWFAPNRQTPLGFFKFMSLIYQADELAHDEASRTELYDEFVKAKEALEKKEKEAGMSLDEPRPVAPEIDPRKLESSVINTFLRPVFDEVQALAKGLRTKFKKPDQPEKETFNLINNEIFKLQVWKASQVENEKSPQLSNVYRQWSVALSDKPIASERANWLITDNDVDKSSGTLKLSYPAIDKYNQEVI